MKKMIIILCITICLLTANKQKEEFLIPDEAIRFRVIANSNDPIDQVTKMELVKNIYPQVVASASSAQNITEARQNIQKLTKDLEPVINQYSNDYRITYGQNYFPEKEYKGISYSAGNYESLVIELGQAQGENWWCVLFPPLCLLEAEENNTNEVEYKMLTSEIINKYMP